MPKGLQKGNAFSPRAPKGARIKSKAPRASSAPSSKKRLPPNEGCDMCDKLLFLCTICTAAVTTLAVLSRRGGRPKRKRT